MKNILKLRIATKHDKMLPKSEKAIRVLSFGRKKQKCKLLGRGKKLGYRVMLKGDMFQDKDESC